MDRRGRANGPDLARERTALRNPAFAEAGARAPVTRWLHPEQWQQAGQSEGHQKGKALAAGLAIGESVGVDPLDHVIAGGGDQDRGGRDFERSERAGGLGHAQDEGIDIGDAHDGREDVDACVTEVGHGQLGGHQHREKKKREEKCGTEFEGIAGLELALDLGLDGVGAAGPEPSGEDCGGGEREKSGGGAWLPADD